MPTRRPALAATLLLLLAPGAARPWGEDGHTLILEEAITALPPDVWQRFEGNRRELGRLVMEPDRRSQTPMEGCKHWINVEKLAPGYAAVLEHDLLAAYGDDGYADEDARGVAARLDATFFRTTPAPWPAARVDPLWDTVPPTLEAFRRRYGHLEVFIGSVVYQPLLYTRALAGALASRDRKRVPPYLAYLAHYTGDLHVPVHVSSNYKGQYSGNLTYDDKERGDVHARFESGFVKAELDALRREVRRRLPPPRALAPDAITPRAIREAREAYALLPAILAADQAATRTADPRRDWEKYLAKAAPAFREPAARQLAAATALLADLLMTAAAGPLSPVRRAEPSSTIATP
jgi:hypothetical protein